VHEVSTPEAAELTKLLENIYRAVNIALVNELALLTDRMGIDVWEVIDAAPTKPLGFQAF
jgi:UDP-N-acetyl-D-glucosamine dehydrogenase